MKDGYCRVVAEVNLDHIEHNIREIRKIVQEDSDIMAVVKADAYGHGVVEIAKVLLNNGVNRLAVAILEEAIQLRKAGFTVPILILGFTPKEDIHDVVKYNITQTVFTYELAKSIHEEAKKQNKIAKIHIKVDTGMGRIGFLPDANAIQEIKKIKDLSNVFIEGMFTHFSSADEQDRTYTDQQFKKFIKFDKDLQKSDVFVPIKHVANSAGILSFPEYHLDLVRPGIILYGLYPSKEVDCTKIQLKPAMTLKSHISYVKEVEAGVCISYGREFIAKKKTKIATIPVGYADGFSRLLSNKGEVLIQGKKAKICGRICMDQFMVDVSHIPEVKQWDEVVLFGEQENMTLSIEEVAEKIGTINYEVICMVGKRIPRKYILNGEMHQVINYLLSI